MPWWRGCFLRANLFSKLNRGRYLLAGNWWIRKEKAKKLQEVEGNKAYVLIWSFYVF